MTAYSPPPSPTDEEARQIAVDRSGILDRRGDGELQRIVDRAASRFDAPIAAVTIIDRRRQWIAASRGVDVCETERDVAFCAHVLLRPAEILLVPDTLLDPRFRHHPLVVGEPHIRFYAGVPLTSRAGYALGALCVVDVAPRPRDIDLFELSVLAREAEAVVNRR